MVAISAAGRREPTAPAAGAACARVDSTISIVLAVSMAVAGSVDSTAAAGSVDSTAAAGGASCRNSTTSDDRGGRRNEHVALTRVEQDFRCSRGRLFGADRHDCFGAFVPEKTRQHGGGYHG